MSTTLILAVGAFLVTRVDTALQARLTPLSCALALAQFFNAELAIEVLLALGDLIQYGLVQCDQFKLLIEHRVRVVELHQHCELEILAVRLVPTKAR